MKEINTIEELIPELKKCRKCQEEFGYEPRPVVWGSPNAKIMQISQAPSKKVHEIGRPFSDLSGKKLRQNWYEITDEQFYNGDNFYITTVGHCFPGKSGRNNYDKKPPKCCYEMWTKKEIELKKNTQLYLIVGGEAASRLFPKRKLTDLVFEDLTINGIKAYVLPHPSPLNIKWFKDHPEFERDRLPQIRKAIHQLID